MYIMFTGENKNELCAPARTVAMRRLLLISALRTVRAYLSFTPTTTVTIVSIRTFDSPSRPSVEDESHSRLPPFGEFASRFLLSCDMFVSVALPGRRQHHSLSLSLGRFFLRVSRAHSNTIVSRHAQKLKQK